jgi:hypothetical protein
VASRADEYRRRAEQCLEMARTFGDHNARVTLSHMAEVWLRLTDNLDADGSFAPLKGEVRPVIQQQQQIQPKASTVPRRNPHQRENAKPSERLLCRYRRASFFDI